MRIEIYKTLLTTACCFMSAGFAGAQTGSVAVSSPDNLIQITFSAATSQAQAAGGALTYQVTYRGKTLIEKSNLGLDLQDQPALGPDLRITASKPSNINESYSVPAGKSNPVRNECNVLAIDLTESGRSARRLTIEARAYNDGVAFRYVIPDEPRTKDVRIVNEKTQFVIADDATMYPLILRNFQTSWEDNYRTLAVTGVHPESLVGLPLLMELPGKAWLAITEADIENYAGMYVQHSTVENFRILEARLSPRVDQPGIAVTGQTPMRSPWRVIMIGDSPGRLIESNIVENLNPTSVIADTSWIKARQSRVGLVVRPV